MNLTQKPDKNGLRLASYITLGIATVIVFVALLASAARAGEVEAAVIVEAQEQLGDTMVIDGVTSDQLYAEIENLMDIWNDTSAGSHCEQYAASLVSVATAAWFVADDPEFPITYVALTGLSPLIEQTDTLYNNCLNEE